MSTAIPDVLKAELPATKWGKVLGATPVVMTVIATLLGVTAEEMWDIRNKGLIPPGALPRVRAFAEAQP